jgi:hypothetical protein
MKTNKNNSSAPNQRRNFIKTATKLTGVFALLGLSTEGFKTVVSAQGERERDGEISPRERTIALLFNEAMSTGDMKSAIIKYQNEAKLTNEQITGLQSISKAELSILKKVREKLIPLNLPAIALSMAPAMAPARRPDR